MGALSDFFGHVWTNTTNGFVQSAKGAIGIQPDKVQDIQSNTWVTPGTPAQTKYPSILDDIKNISMGNLVGADMFPATDAPVQQPTAQSAQSTSFTSYALFGGIALAAILFLRR